MHLVTELLADRRKLEQIKTRCKRLAQVDERDDPRHVMALEIINDFFPEATKELAFWDRE